MEEKRRGWGVRRQEILVLIPDIKKKILETKCNIKDALACFGIETHEYHEYISQDIKDEVKAVKREAVNTTKVLVVDKVSEIDNTQLPNFTKQNLRMSPIVQKDIDKSKEFLSREEIKAQIIAVMSNMDSDLNEFVKGLDMRTGKLVERQRITQDQANILDFHLMHLYLDFQKI